MDFGTSVTGLIQNRTSWRSYREEILGEDDRKRMQDYIDGLAIEPFGSKVRFSLIEAAGPETNKVRGTYGIIRGAKNYIIGLASGGEMDMEDFGYCFEKIILYATSLDLGTCWMGGTYSRKTFGEKISMEAGETIVAISPVGYCANRRTIVDSVTRFAAGSKNRKPWGDMFFAGSFSSSLTKLEAGEYSSPLEMVRLGPSASNKQPWRVIKDDKGFHFYVQRDKMIKRMFKYPDLQRVDIGIAMCHFELTARELGLKGGWQKASPDASPLPENTEYIISWI